MILSPSTALVLALAPAPAPAPAQVGSGAAVDHVPRRAGVGPWSVSLELGSTSYDYAPRSFGPGLSGAAEIEVAARRVFRLRLGPRIGYAAVPGLIRTFGVGARTSASWRLRRGFTAELALDLGYRHHWLGAPRYIVEDGELVVSGGLGRGAPSADLGLGVGLGYDFGPRTGAPLTVLVVYRPRVLGPFWPGTGVPVMISSTVALQLRVELGPRGRRSATTTTITPQPAAPRSQP